MKKVLATVAALGLVAGIATTASALDVPQTAPATGLQKAAAPTAPGVSFFSVTGDYSLAGAYLSNGNGLGGGADLFYATGSDENPDDTWYIHTFKLMPTLRVNDKIQVKMELRFADRNIFGADDLNMTNGLPVAPVSGGSEGRMMDVHKVYMEYMSPVGKIRVGRTPGAAWYGKFLNNATNRDRIMWWPSFVSKPWSLMLLTQKSTDGDALSATESDNDVDFYMASLDHKGDLGNTAVAYTYTRTAGNTAGTDDITGASNIWAYANWKKDNFTLESELEYGFGEATPTTDRSTFAFMADAGMAMGDLNVGLLYFYLSGDDNLAAGDAEAAFGANGVGKDYNPYQILTGDYMGILNPDKASAGEGFAAIRPQDDPTTLVDESKIGVNAGVSSIGVHASYKVSPKLTVNGALGTAWANETPAGWDDSYGIEFDLGASYKLYDNLTYGVHFGYLNTGDFFEAGSTTTKTNNVFLLAHQLTMKF
jgi:hypothetical protein